MNAQFCIYALVTGPEGTFVGCTRGEIPPEAIRLQTVSDHPKANWVKWCLRFRRTLKDRRGIEDPLAQLFTNQARIKRLLDSEAVLKLEAEKCKDFMAFHSHNPKVLEDIIAEARAERLAGRTVYAVEAHLASIRWNPDLSTQHSGDNFKIDSVWAAWYSRLIQMLCSDLIGFFRLRVSLADGLVFEGRNWRAFAEEHADDLHYELLESLDDSDWEHNG